ncbi:hypothetical protein D5086_027251 [Populus alba]|uniref:Uncharacterized protein n=1 Tax=Populus alba TaxID=43335 RepID=A0ACC4AUV6_POPAL
MYEASSKKHTSSRGITPKFQKATEFGNWGIEVGMPRNSLSQKRSPFAEGSVDVEQCRQKHTCQEGITRNFKAFEFAGNRGASEVGMSQKLTNVKAYRCLRKKWCILEQRESTRNSTWQLEFRQPGHQSRNAVKLTGPQKPFRRLRNKCDVEQVAQAYMLKRVTRNSRQLNFCNRVAIRVGMPETHRSQRRFRFAEEVQSVSPFVEEISEVEQVAEAYMLKRDHPKFKGTEFRQPGHRSRNCRTHPCQKRFRCLRKEVKPGIEGPDAVKLTESKRFAVCGRKCDVKQVAEAYTLKTDHPKFKGNSISATGASKSECRETHRVKAFRLLRKKCDVEQVAEAYMLKRDHPKFKGN